MEEKEKPNYYAVIPAVVRYDNELRANEKLLYGEISALANKTGICTASNNYFAKLYKVTPQAISKWIINLQKRNYVSVNYVKKGKEVESRNIRLEVVTNVNRVSTNIDRVSTNDCGGYQQNIKENNTSINNINNMNIIYNCDSNNYCECLTKDGNKCQRKSCYQINGINFCNQHSKPILDRFFKFEDNVEEFQNEINEIINYFNNCSTLNEDQFKNKKEFKLSKKNKESLKLINARLNDGYTVDDFKDVIFIKYMDFVENEYQIEGKSSIRYYRPETLFSNKNFAKYKNDYEVWSETC